VQQIRRLIVHTIRGAVDAMLRPGGHAATGNERERRPGRPACNSLRHLRPCRFHELPVCPPRRGEQVVHTGRRPGRDRGADAVQLGRQSRHVLGGPGPLRLRFFQPVRQIADQVIRLDDNSPCALQLPGRDPAGTARHLQKLGALLSCCRPRCRLLPFRGSGFGIGRRVEAQRPLQRAQVRVVLIQELNLGAHVRLRVAGTGRGHGGGPRPSPAQECRPTT
jgi:hypothetical protein